MRAFPLKRQCPRGRPATSRSRAGACAILLRGLAMKVLLVAFITAVASFRAAAVPVYTQPPSAAGGVNISSWIAPDGTDADQYCFDDFTLAADTAIAEIDWRGGYQYAASYGHVTAFTIRIYGSIAGGSQPNVTSVLKTYNVSGVAGEVLVGTVGGIAMYDYHYTLTTPFQATAGTKYWVQIEATQPAYPDWGIATGTGGDNSHFRHLAPGPYQVISGDTAFTLQASAAPAFTVAASESPAGSGTISGAGAYPSGSTASLTATANAGYGFANWTEAGGQVSTSRTYNFTVTRNRTLVANFVPAYTVTVSPSSTVAGSAGGGGVFNSGSSATVTATSAPGFSFVNWTQNGAPVSASASYTFSVGASTDLVANFALLPATAVIDFDTSTPPVFPHGGLPASQTNRGLTAYFGTLAGGWSVQDGFIGGVTPKFSGNFLYPSTWGSSLKVTFSEPLTDVGFDFETGEVSSEYNVAATVRVVAFSGTTNVGTGLSQGAWITGAYPEGHLAFHSATPFDSVTIDIAPIGVPSYILFVDNMVMQRAVVTTYNIAASATPPASGTVSGSGAYLANDSVLLSAIANPGYAFVNWTEGSNAVGTLADYAFLATGNRTLVAHFAPAIHVTAGIGGNVGGTVVGDGVYPAGASVTLTATADPGYTFVNWTRGSVAVSTAPAYSFTANADFAVVANFALIIPQISTPASPPGSITLAWPAGLPGWSLEESPDLSPGSWAPSAELIGIHGANNQVVVLNPAGNRFFRLTHP